MNTLTSIETRPEDRLQLDRQAKLVAGLTGRPAANDATKNNWCRKTIEQADREIFRHRACLVMAALFCVLLIGISINYYIIG